MLSNIDIGTTPLVVSTYGNQREVAAAAAALGLEHIVTLYDGLYIR